ncbi:MAG: hypothetical protein IPI73_02435 [Betaproteobacteria bacterium]|nr:hypothetical protein [Betaproteobacteria bacterium]
MRDLGVFDSVRVQTAEALMPMAASRSRSRVRTQDACDRRHGVVFEYRGRWRRSLLAASQSWGGAEQLQFSASISRLVAARSILITGSARAFASRLFST